MDGKGRVVARVGDNDKEYGDYIGGAEVIADALRGYMSDDVWGNGGKLVRVAAAPVLSKNHDRIVGAIYVGAETGPNLVERLKKNLDVDVALLLRGKVIASTRDAGSLAMLPDLVDKHAADIEKVKRTSAIALQAGARQPARGGGAVPRPGRPAAGLLRAARHAAGDVGPAVAAVAHELGRPQVGQLPVDPAARGASRCMIGVGLLLQRREIEGPLESLRKDLQQLARGEITQAQRTAATAASSAASPATSTPPWSATRTPRRRRRRWPART